MFKKRFVNIVISIAFLLGTPFFVSAQKLSENTLNEAESVGISINQSVFSFESDPGKDTEFKITVENTSQSEQKLSIYAQDFSVSDGNKIQILSEANELAGMKDWINIGEKDLVLRAGEKKEIGFLLKVPQDAVVGSHWTGLFFQVFPPINADNFQKTIVSGRVGSFILLNVSGNVSGKGNLNKFSSPVFVGKEAGFQTEFENQGNVYYIPHGEIVVKNLLTKKEKKMEAEKHFVFPGKKYFFDLKWNPESALGIYRADAYFVDGDKNIHRSSRVVFGKMFFPVLVLIAIILMIVLKIFQKRRNQSEPER